MFESVSELQFAVSFWNTSPGAQFSDTMYRITSFGRRTSLLLRHLNVVFLRGLSTTFSVPPEKSNSELTRSPPPIRVALTEFAGRGVFATRRIGSGDLIHTATPVVAHPSLSLLHKVCYFCLKQLGVNRNAAYIHAGPTGNTNQRVCFCNEDCRERSKVFHEVECLADWSVYDEYCRSRRLKYPLLLKRLACMVISGALLPDQLDILQPETLSPEKISAMQEGFDMLRSILTASSIDNEQMTFLTEQWYISMLARIRINAFRVELVSILYEDLLSSAAASVEAEAAVGNAVYMLPSFYNHDCDPNVHIIWTENVDARVKALRDIDEGRLLIISDGLRIIDLSWNLRCSYALLRRKVKSYASATLMQAWIVTLGKPSFWKGLGSGAIVFVAFLVIRADLP